MMHGFSSGPMLGGMNLEKILKSLTGVKPRSSADLRNDLQAIDLAALEQDVDKLEAERRHLLIHGSDDELQANAAAITAANLQCERGAAAVEELKKQIAAAESREAAEAIETAATAAQQEKAKLVATHSKIEVLAAEMTTLLRDADASSEALARWNARAEKIAPDRKLAFTHVMAIKQKLMKAFR